MVASLEKLLPLLRVLNTALACACAAQPTSIAHVPGAPSATAAQTGVLHLLQLGNGLPEYVATPLRPKPPIS